MGSEQEVMGQRAERGHQAAAQGPRRGAVVQGRRMRHFQGNGDGTW